MQSVPEGLLKGKSDTRLSRNSKDDLVNANGKKLLCEFEDSNLIILNGRTAGDTNDEFTFKSKGTATL